MLFKLSVSWGDAAGLRLCLADFFYALEILEIKQLSRSASGGVMWRCPTAVDQETDSINTNDGAAVAVEMPWKILP